MKSLLLLIINIIAFTVKGLTQIIQSDTVIVASNDTNKFTFKSGFYFAVLDSSKSLGFPLLNSDGILFFKHRGGSDFKKY